MMENSRYSGNILLPIILLLLVVASSCNKVDTEPDEPATFTPPGVFVVNEGNFTTGNASLTWYNIDNVSVINDAFYSVNKVPLGDVANYMTIFNGKGYVVINNSGLIYRVNIEDGTFAGKISGLASPREILVVNDKLAFVSDLSDKFLTLINPTTLEITGKIDLAGRSSESMRIIGNRLFVANWSGLNQTKSNDVIMVVNIDQLMLTDTIKVTKEPNSMVVDKNGKLWVLCSGGYENQVIPALYQINPNDNSVLKKVEFPNKNCNPIELSINSNGNQLYYIKKDVYRMDVSDVHIPLKPFIESEKNNFYSLNISPGKEYIFVSDALDYVRNGQVYIYNKTGILAKQFEAGIIPGYFCFYEKGND